MLPHVRGIFFDFDGTLVDSYSIHIDAYRQTFERFGLTWNEPLFRSTYSPDWLQTYRAFALPEEHWSAADKHWVECVSGACVPAFAGAAAALTKLRESRQLGIVTSGSRIRVMQDLQLTALGEHFGVVITGDDIEHRKPNPDGLHRAMSALGLSAAECAYVGDAAADCEMALAAGVPFIGVRSNFAHWTPPEGTVLVDSVADLPALFR